MIYFIIAFFATTIGGIAGIGGGLIIKPFLTLSTNIDVENVTIISSITILAMSGTTIIHKGEARKNVIENFYYIVAGSLIGGIVGNQILALFLRVVGDNNKAELIQSIILILLLIFILASKYIKVSKTFNSGKLKLFILGVSLGIVSSFLGIGGGLINVALLTIFFGMDLKEATFTSIFIIFFSQLSNILTYIVTGVLWQNNLLPVIFTIPAAILGGIVGSYLNKILSNKQVKIIYDILIIFLLVLNMGTIFFIIR